jgi:hypothetical protein
MIPLQQTDTHKFCPDCQDWLPLEQFHKHRGRTGGYSSYCRKHANARVVWCNYKNGHTRTPKTPPQDPNGAYVTKGV